MLDVTRVRVRSLDIDYWQITWEIEPTQEDVLHYTFQLLRSESVAGPYEPICVPFSDQYVFFDRLTHPFQLERVLFYKLVVRHQITDEVREFGPYDSQPEADLIALEIRRHFQIMFQEHSGRRVWLLPKRTFGQRCPSCFDALSEQRSRSGCPQCYDTGFARGYHHPIELWAEVNQRGTRVTRTVAGLQDQSVDNTARLVDVGSLKTGDILVEGENRRWRIFSVDTTEHGRATLLYDVGLHEIPQSDIEYAIPLNLDQALSDIWLSPSRNFTNPSNLETFADGEISDILSLYPGLQSSSRYR